MGSSSAKLMLLNILDSVSLKFLSSDELEDYKNNKGEYLENGEENGR